MSALPLFDWTPPAPRAPDPQPSNHREECFRKFHAENPHVYQRLAELARQAKSRLGVKRFGIRLLWEKLRWELVVETERPEGAPALNDWYPPFYSRLLMRQESDLAGLFEIRGEGCDG